MTACPQLRRIKLESLVNLDLPQLLLKDALLYSTYLLRPTCTPIILSLLEARRISVHRITKSLEEASIILQWIQAKFALSLVSFIQVRTPIVVVWRLSVTTVMKLRLFVQP